MSERLSAPEGLVDEADAPSETTVASPEVEARKTGSGLPEVGAGPWPENALPDRHGPGPGQEEDRVAAQPVAEPADAVVAGGLGLDEEIAPVALQPEAEGTLGTAEGTLEAEAEPARGPSQVLLEAELNSPAQEGAPDEQTLRLAEALVFSSATPVSARALTQVLPAGMDAAVVIAAMRERYAGRGVELIEVAGGIQFRTAPDLAPQLRKVVKVPRRLPRVAMETLAIVAYHQPVTRPEIEEIRGTALSQQTLDTLLEANLIAPKGRRESPGRPTLWGTTAHFLTQFGLTDLRDLPKREDLLLETPQPASERSGLDSAGEIVTQGGTAPGLSGLAADIAPDEDRAEAVGREEDSPADMAGAERGNAGQE